MVFLLCALLFSGQAFSAQQTDQNQGKPGAKPIPVPNPAADLWREVRQRDMSSQGNTQVRGVDSNQFIEVKGEEFRDYRRELLIPYTPYALGGLLVLIAAVFIVKGKIKIDGGRSGQTIKRFGEFDRVVHWYLAILFIFLGLTGLILMLGRFLVLPMFGHEAFSVIASACKEGHNLFGPLFLVGVVLMFVRFAAKNIPKAVDFVWLLRGGGLLGGGHASAGFFNGGEKLWFWLVMILGLLLCTSGFVLIFPNFEQGRDIMQLALFAHGIGALILILGSFGHMYIGSIGSDGSLDSMVTGDVDTNWAKQHHDLWYQDEMRKRGDQGQKSAAGH
jgi:formate dehydrogenase subunit gamma